MSIRNLDTFFSPQSIAVIGASQREGRAGALVLRNLTDARYRGTVYAVNPKYDRLGSNEVYRRIADLPQAPDLAILCTPPTTLPGLIAELGRRGTKAAIVITPVGNERDSRGRRIGQAMLEEAKPHLLRMLGPSGIGMMVPRIGLNGSVARIDALPGRIAFVAQSGSLMTGMLDWARSRGIGFSKVVCLGDSIDIDVADMLDYLAGDPDTQAILLCLESIRHARKFMSAARAAARGKRVVVIKAGRVPEGARAMDFHAGALTMSDDVADAAIRRAGMLRVFSTEQLFDAVETLAGERAAHGERLAIVSNGGGPGMMAADALVAAGGRLAIPSDDTVRRLASLLPGRPGGGVIDLGGSAPAGHYVDAVGALLHDPRVDAILCIHAPGLGPDSTGIAQALADIVKDASRSVLTCWLGGDAMGRARHLFAEAGVPTYDTPEKAVGGFMQMVQYRRNQNLLMQVPPSIPAEFIPDRGSARTLVREALAAGRTVLSEPEALSLLAAYGIPVAPMRNARNADEAARCAEEIGFPVALKILSPEIAHKSDVGGVVLDLETAEAVRVAAYSMGRRLVAFQPSARPAGFAVQAMARRPQAHELIVGVSTDPVFGPVILFGEGGVAVEVTADHAVCLPPLNMVLARDLVSHTRIARLLAGYRNRAPADIDTICRTLVQVSHLVTDIAEVAELDINPLLADSRGVIALDARLRLAPAPRAVTGVDRLAIRPYPEELEEIIHWQESPLLLRPIRPEDAPQHVAFFNALDPEDVRLRTFMKVRELQAWQVSRLTQIDYDREMAFVATRHGEGGCETLGVARVIANPDNLSAEFAVIVRSDLKGRGLGTILMNKLIDYSRSRGTRELVGETMSGNTGLLNLVRRLGFEIRPAPEPGTMLLRLLLAPGVAAEIPSSHEPAAAQ